MSNGMQGNVCAVMNTVQLVQVELLVYDGDVPMSKEPPSSLHLERFIFPVGRVAFQHGNFNLTFFVKIDWRAGRAGLSRYGFMRLVNTYSPRYPPLPVPS